MSQTIYELFRDRAISQPDRLAVLCPGWQAATYGELLRFVDETRSRVHRSGVRKTSRSGILIPRRAQAAVAHLALSSTCISVPMNPDMAPDELEETVHRLQLDTLLLGEAASDRLTERAVSLGVRVLRTDDHAETAGFFGISGDVTASDTDIPLPVAEDLATLMQTSGTTSKQKTVPRTHAIQVAQLTGFGEAIGMLPTDRCLNLMPIYHTTGIGSEFLAPILSGASVVFAEFIPAKIEALVEEHMPTWFTVVPSMHQAVLATLGGRRDVFKRSSLRFTRSSSAKLTVALRDQLETAYGVRLVEAYGSTELGTIAFTRVVPGDFRSGSVGRPAHTGVAVLDGDGKPVPAGVKGEVCVHGPTVMTGYEDDPDANAAAARDGYHRTGDEAYIDDDGFLFITGRLDETVNRGGEKLSLMEIDEEVQRTEGVALGASFSYPHPELGHEVYAAVVPIAGRELRPKEVRADLALRLSWAKVPKRVFIVAELPFTSTGKVLRKDLATLMES